MKKIINFIIISTLTLFSNFCYASPPIKVIIDTDMGLDDWAAISYTLNNPELEVVAITVTGMGAARCNAGVINALDLILLSRKVSKNIPVACGEIEPLQGYHFYPKILRDAVDKFYGENILRNPQKPSPLHGVELLEKVISESAEPPVILALGPLTNIAKVLDKNPALESKIEKIIIMGGAIKAPGNIIVENWSDYLKNEVAEWNIYIDPLAAQKTFRSKVPLVLVPLDGSNHAKITDEFANYFISMSRTPEAVFLGRVFDKNRGFIASNEYYFWDPLAAALIDQPDICEYESLNIDVAVEFDDNLKVDYELPSFSKKLEGGKERRMLDLYKSGHTYISDKTKKVQVCMKANREKFIEHFVKIINIE